METMTPEVNNQEPKKGNQGLLLGGLLVFAVLAALAVVLMVRPGQTTTSTTTKTTTANASAQLDQNLKSLDQTDLDSFNKDLNANTTDASSF